MLKKLTMLVIVHTDNKYTAYFFNKAEKVILALPISDNTMRFFIDLEQTICCDLSCQLATKVMDAEIGFKVSCEICIPEFVMDSLGIKVTKEMLSNALLA